MIRTVYNESTRRIEVYHSGSPDLVASMSYSESVALVVELQNHLVDLSAAISGARKPTKPETRRG